NSTMWRKGGRGEVLCNSCGLKQLSPTIKESDSPEPQIINPTAAGKSSSSINNSNNAEKSKSQNSVNESTAATRKSSRIKPPRMKGSSGKNFATKGKNRRVIFKKNPIKSATSVATVVTTTNIFHNGIYYQVGDIVSLVDDEDDEGVYYAQIRGFLQDQYCEKSAVITWLLPTLESTPGRFDPATFILGPEEDIPRKMDYLDFVCHAPSDYYKSRGTPFSTIPLKPELAFIWTSIGPQINTLPTTDEIFGVNIKETRTQQAAKKELKMEG
ncbi:unnamed protein product, partial [Owenia fusiformis]